MTGSHTAFLCKLVEEISVNLPEATQRRVFGCDAFFANGLIYALIWKIGRIELKILDTQLFTKLMLIPGSQLWRAGDKIMSYWVLVPETFHSDQFLLDEWVHCNYTLTSKDSHLQKKRTRKKK